MTAPRANPDFTPSGELVLVGADDAFAVRAAIERLSAFLSAAPQARLRDIALTCATEFRDSPFKVAIVATSAEDLADKLRFAKGRLEAGVVRNSFNRGIYIGTEQCPAPGRTVFLFPGEGTQYPDMLRELALKFPACRAAFDAADTAVASAASEAGAPPWPPPSHYVFPTSPDAAARDIRSLPTPLAIQTVLAADTALLFLFAQLGIAPDAVMGVGVGELVALECAGAIPLPTKRHRIMMLGEGYRMISEITSSRKAVADCATLSVAGPSRDALAALLAPFGDGAIIAADQAPELFTVAVSAGARAEVEAALAAAGAAFHPLASIDKPFHTPLMAPFADHFRRYYGSLVGALPRIPVYSCCTQAPIDGATPDEVAETAAMQWTRPINVAGTIRRLYDDGFRVFVELGARGGLTACVASTLRRMPHLAVASNRGHRPDLLQLNHALAALVSHGARFDAAILHAGRDSRILDLGRPGDCRPPRRSRERPIPSIMPFFSDVPLPQGLVAPAPQGATAKRHEGDSPGATDFPCLDLAEVVRFAPDSQIDLSFHLSPADFPYLSARALSAGPVSAYDKSSHGLTPLPLELLAEIMAEAARKLCPGRVVIRIENLASPDAFKTVSKSAPDVLVQARREAMRGGETVVAASVRRRAAGSEGDGDILASCAIVLAAEYPAAPQPAPLSLRNSLRAGWDPNDIYPGRLPFGECCRAIRAVPETGDNGLSAECAIPPRRGILRASAQPLFSAAPVCLAVASDVLALRDQREPASGTLHIFAGAAKIEFFSPPLPEWASFTTRVFAAADQQMAAGGAAAAVADAEIADADHRLVLRVAGIANRVVRIPRALHRIILNPAGASLSEEVPQQSLPALPHEVVCRRVDDAEWPDDEDDDLRLRIAASIALTPMELERWADLPDSRGRRHEWLFGRVAAKDAVRKCLLARYGRQIGAADVAVETDEAGKPSPQGPWRRTCGAPMDISITHTAGCVFAAAAPNAALGIDAERADRSISEDFANFAFSRVEREMAAESGDGATTLFRFWCAKEAMSKSLGSGLRFGPNDLSATALDVATGRVEMSATRLWLEAFPQLRGMSIPVHTCLLGDFVLAVCAKSRDSAP